jgi:hypothetical protein
MVLRTGRASPARVARTVFVQALTAAARNQMQRDERYDDESRSPKPRNPRAAHASRLAGGGSGRVIGAFESVQGVMPPWVLRTASWAAPAKFQFTGRRRASARLHYFRLPEISRTPKISACLKNSGAIRSKRASSEPNLEYRNRCWSLERRTTT